jgi:hypothetical protein
MPSSSLATYTIQVRFKGKRHTEPLGSFGETKHDLLPILQTYLKGLQATVVADEAEKKLLQVTAINSDTKAREITGTIDHGEWGVAVPGKSWKTGAINYQRTLEDVEPLPYYYLLSVPKEGRMGFAILQRFGNLGLRSQLLDRFERRFAQEYPDFRMNIQSAAPGELLDQFMKEGASVQKLSFIQTRLPRNFEDRYANPGEAAQEAYAEYVIHAKRGGSLPLINLVRNAVRGQGNSKSQLLQLSPRKAAKLKVAIRVGGVTRTLEMTEAPSMRSYYEIDDQVEYGKNGLPTFESVDELAHGLLDKQYEALGL